MAATVLVVDDEPDIRELVRINLEHAGYRVRLAHDGADALDAVAEDPPDAVFLDVMMPGVDGWEVLDILKQSDDARIAGIPVLMLTACGDDIDRLRGNIDGALRYITKPFRPSQLVAALEEVLGAAVSEPERRRQVQRQALVELARLERGEPLDLRDPAPVVHLTRLEHVPETATEPAPRVLDARDHLGTLSDRQLALLRLVAAERSVTAVAEQLGVSRSNVYASLRRIVRKLHLRGSAELLALVRAGGLLEAPARH